jgi:hypothetical protein
MSDRYDVAARLAEGESALDHIQTYVQACHTLGYQQPDLTARPSQVGDWYGTEAGLDLRVLNGDATELRVALTALEEALWVQRTQVTELAAAWRGSGAESAARFLQRHCDAAEEVVAHVRAAAEQCATLGDGVWQAVDGKVATTVAIDERHAPDRSTWLAAAQTVVAGSGDRSTAELIVHQKVMPFVDNDIRNDWLAAISAASASVAASYDTAIHALSSPHDVRFDIPGELGPRWQPVAEDRAVAEVVPATTLPGSPVPTVPAAVPVSAPPVAEPEDVAAAPLDDLAGLSSGTGGLGGLGGMTGGLGGIVGSIVDGLGGLLGSLMGGGSGMGREPIDLDDADDPRVDDAGELEDAEEPAVLDEEVAPAAPAAESQPAPAAESQPATGESVAPPVDPPPPTDEPPPESPPQPVGATPCEIAEDQLPQVGQ